MWKSKWKRHKEMDDGLAGFGDGERSQSYDVFKRQASNGHMINAASPDLSSKTCGSVRAHATDRRWKTGFDFHRRPRDGVVGATGALLRDCHQNSWVIFKWPNSGMNPFGLAWLNLCLHVMATMGGKVKKSKRITSESQTGLALRVQTRHIVKNKPLCTTSSKASQCF